MEKIKLTKRQIDIFHMWNEGLSQTKISRELKTSFSYINKTLRLVFERLGIKMEGGVVSYARRDIKEIKEYTAYFKKLRQDRKEEMVSNVADILINMHKLKLQVDRI